MGSPSDLASSATSPAKERERSQEGTLPRPCGGDGPRNEGQRGKPKSYHSTRTCAKERAESGGCAPDGVVEDPQQRNEVLAEVRKVGDIEASGAFETVRPYTFNVDVAVDERP